MDNVITDIQSFTALQQPEWYDPPRVRRMREILRARPPLVPFEDVRTLRTLLARVAAGEAHVVQSGDCAEDPDACTAAQVSRKAALVDQLAAQLKARTGRPVLRVGRLAGQFAKPRSRPTEQVGGRELPVYRGHFVNGPEPDEESRQPDPLRLLTGYMAADDVLRHLGWRDPAPRVEPPVWTSHEALLLDYELPMLREEGGRRWLASTHWPWIGERTRQLDGAHVALLAEVANPVACKVGPRAAVDEVLGLCERLDPWREPGRLTLIARMGAGEVADRLPPLVRAVRAAGHPVVWLSDPMHGNTVTTAAGVKTRLLPSIAAELRGFCAAVLAEGGRPGGVHLETTPEEVAECAADERAAAGIGDRYTSLCDPRLTLPQALSVLSAWEG